MRARSLATRISIATALAATSIAVSSLSPIGLSGIVEAAPYEPLDAPQRIVDTRAGGETADGVDQKSGPLAAGATATIQVAGRSGVAAKAASVVLNITAVNPSQSGFFTVFPCGDRPNSSNLNYERGNNIANTVFATLDESGQTCVFTSSETQLIVDVAGTMPDDAFLGLTPPRRFADTRPTGETFDAETQGSGKQAGGSFLTIPVAGRSGVAADAETVVMNVTSAAAETDGFFTVFPCGVQPTTSNLNFRTGQATANAVVARVSIDGDVCVFTSTNSHIIVDVAGTLAPDAYVPLPEPQRLSDTRVGAETDDGFFQGIGMRNGGSTFVLPVAGRGGVPIGATGVVLNVTAVRSQDAGFLTIHPRGSQRPNASNLNFGRGQNIANTVVARVGGDGLVCLYNSADTEIIVDVAGYLVGPEPGIGGPGCPSDEQRLDSSITADPGFVALVPSELPPGRYEIASTPATCGFGRYDTPFVNGDTPVVGESSSAGNGTRLLVDIRPTDVEFGYGSSCGPIRPYQRNTERATSFGAGTFVVDEHIAIGTYTATLGDGCIFLALESFDGSDESVIGGLVIGPDEVGEQVINITPAFDGIYSTTQCGVWTQIETKPGGAALVASPFDGEFDVSMLAGTDRLWS